MRHKPRKIRFCSRDALFSALTVVSHLAAIAGAIVVILDTLHHW
jgi:preprotein translocase subunit SecE